MLNSQRLHLGVRTNGQVLGDVELPPWATDHKDFVAKMRQALESDYVRQHLHHWIDLVFGYKQRGEEAVKANNGIPIPPPFNGYLLLILTPETQQCFITSPTRVQ